MIKWDVEKRKHLYTVRENVNWCSHYRKQNRISSQNCHMIQQFYFLLYTWRKQKQSFENIHAPSVFISIIYNCQPMEAIQSYINRWMDKEEVICIYTTNYYSAIKKRMKFCHLQYHGSIWRVLCLVKCQTEKNKYPMISLRYGI